MKRSYKILLYILGFFVLLAAAFAVISGLSSPSNQSGNNQNMGTVQPSTTPPILLLDSQEEAKVKEFVKNYVQLYNSYSYGDYSNLTALGDYQTQAMQQKALNTIIDLQNTVPEGFSQSAEPDLSTFSYKYYSVDTLTVNISVKITQSSGTGAGTSPRNPQTSQVRTQQYTLILKDYGQSWIVDDIETK